MVCLTNHFFYIENWPSVFQEIRNETKTKIEMLLKLKLMKTKYSNSFNPKEIVFIFGAISIFVKSYKEKVSGGIL